MIKNAVFLCSIFILLFIGIINVSADTGIYARAIRDSNGNVRWRYALYGGNTINFVKLMKWGNDQPVYCIEPNVDYLDFSQGNYYEAVGDDNVLNISSLNAETLRKLKLFSYYGFGYGDHTDDSWYVATQLEIWNTIDYGSAALREGDINLVESHRSELRNIVNSVMTVPSFQNQTFEQVIGQSAEYIDTNNSIKDYEISSCVNCTASINGNKLIVTSNQVGQAVVNIKRTITNSYKPSIIYYNAGYQKLMEFGTSDPMVSKITLNVIGGTIKIQKIDSETGSNTTQGDATFEDAEFSITDSDGNLVGTIKTNSSGYGELLVGLGEFSVKEVKAPKGYNLNTEEYKVILTQENTEESIMVKEDVIKGHALLTKLYGDDEIGFNKESGAEFDVINSKGEVIDTIITDDDGVALVKLPFGNYKIVQKKGLENYSIADDIELSISENKKIYKFNVKNLSYPRFELFKYDISNSEAVEGSTIEIYKLNTETDEYKLYYSGISDSTGKVYLDIIEIGKYYFVEKEAPQGYVLNDEKHYFEIDSNGKLFKDSLDNVKYSSLEISKYDISNSEAVEGATIEIYKLNTETDEYELYYSGISDSKGKIYLDIIELGNYYFVEKEAPDGYILNDEKHYFEIDEYGKSYYEELSNEKQPIEVPDTSIHESKVFNIFVLICIIGGIGFIIYDKVKKK